MFEDVNTKPIEEENVEEENPEEAEKRMIKRVRAVMGLPVDEEVKYDSENEDILYAMGIKKKKRIFTEEEKVLRKAMGLPLDE